MGQQVYFAAEESDVCARQCCGPQRLRDAHHRQPWRAEFKCCACPGCYCMAGMDCCAQRTADDRGPAPAASSPTSSSSAACLEPSYVIQDAGRKTVLQIRGPACICQGPAAPGTRIPMDLDVRIKAAMVGAVFLIRPPHSAVLLWRQDVRALNSKLTLPWGNSSTHHTSLYGSARQLGHTPADAQLLEAFHTSCERPMGKLETRQLHPSGSPNGSMSLGSVRVLVGAALGIPQADHVGVGVGALTRAARLWPRPAAVADAAWPELLVADAPRPAAWASSSTCRWPSGRTVRWASAAAPVAAVAGFGVVAGGSRVPAFVGVGGGGRCQIAWRRLLVGRLVLSAGPLEPSLRLSSSSGPELDACLRCRSSTSFCFVWACGGRAAALDPQLADQLQNQLKGSGRFGHSLPVSWEKSRLTLTPARGRGAAPALHTSGSLSRIFEYNVLCFH
uniref:Phospholipid scramblase n=1 Tax=Macrostomum lignano TaxID=282301 RepID=A0A1I8FLJ5_9PLAT